MEASNPTRSVGLFVAIGLAVIAVLLIQFGRGSSLFQSGYEVIVKSSNVGGLKKGSSVMVSGVLVGKVKEIELTQDGRSVLLHCWIPSNFRIYSDALFEIEQSGFLGDQFVSIVPTRNQGTQLKDGDMVSASQPFNIQEAARKALALMEKLDSAAARIDEAVERVDSTLLSETNLNEVAQTLGNLKELSVQAQSAVSGVNSLIQEHRPTVDNTLSNLQGFSGKLLSTADRLDTWLNSQEDRLGVLVGDLQSTAGDVRVVAGQARDLAGGLQEGQGVLGALLRSDDWQMQIGATVENLSILSSNLTRHGLLYKPPRTTPRTNTMFRGRTPFR